MPLGHSELPPITTKQFAALSGIVLLISAFSVLYKLGEPSLWVDEAYTWFFVSMPWAKMVQAARIDAVNPPLFYMYAKVISGLLGTSEAALRAPSVLAFLLGLAGSLWVGQQSGGRPGAIAAGWFWAFHPMLVWYARDARPYALAASLGVIGLGMFLHARKDSARRVVTGVGSFTVMAFGLLTHYFFILFGIVTGIMSSLEISRRRHFFRAWAAALLFSVVPLLIWLWWFSQLPSPSFGIGWISRPTLADIPRTLWNLVSGYGSAFDWGSLAFGLVATAFVVAGLRNHLTWGGVTVLLPILGVWGLSQIRPIYVDRYFILLVPFLIPILASGAQRLALGWSGRRPRIRWVGGLIGAAAILTATFGAIQAVHYQPAYAKEQWKEVAGWLHQLPPETTILLSERELALPLSYYAPDVQPAGTISEVVCPSRCAWVLRQPYTSTHAFSQSVADPKRAAWQPGIPGGCTQTEAHKWPTGLETILMVCQNDG